MNSTKELNNYRDLTNLECFVDSMMNKKKILIVDDEIIVHFMKEFLELEGFEVQIARDGVEGLEKIKHNRYDYDVILCDMAMPRMNGDELYLEVQKLSTDLVKRIIFVLGLIDAFVISTGNRFLSKPFNRQQLVQVVKDFLADFPNC